MVNLARTEHMNAGSGLDYASGFGWMAPRATPGQPPPLGTGREHWAGKMKRIEAWVNPSELNDVAAALREAGVAGATATEVGSGENGVAATISYRGASYAIEFLSKAKLEAVVHNDVVEQVISALMTTRKAAGEGNWEIFVLQDDAVRIRTGEIAEAAIA